MADTQIVKPIGLSSARPRAGAHRGRAVRYRLGRLMLYGVLLLGGIISLIPFAWMMSASLMTLGETVTRQLLPSVPRFENYVQAWQDAKLRPVLPQQRRDCGGHPVRPAFHLHPGRLRPSPASSSRAGA